MKTRYDFVSNSSSTSFIVEVNDTFVNNVNVFSIADNTYFFADRDSGFSPNLLAELRNTQWCTVEDENCIAFDAAAYVKNPNPELLKKIGLETEGLDVEYGDDCGGQSDFYAYAYWLLSNGFAVKDSDNSSLDFSGFDYFNDKFGELK